jgi:hypothetical protein
MEPKNKNKSKQVDKAIQKRKRKLERKRAREIWWKNSELKLIIDTVNFVKWIT